jgi:hypothetical protein
MILFAGSQWVCLTQQSMIQTIYLKQLILDNIPDVQFTTPSDKTKLEQEMSTKLRETHLAGVIWSHI